MKMHFEFDMDELEVATFYKVMAESKYFSGNPTKLFMHGMFKVANQLRHDAAKGRPPVSTVDGEILFSVPGEPGKYMEWTPPDDYPYMAEYKAALADVRAGDAAERTVVHLGK